MGREGWRVKCVRACVWAWLQQQHLQAAHPGWTITKYTLQRQSPESAGALLSSPFYISYRSGTNLPSERDRLNPVKFKATPFWSLRKPLQVCPPLYPTLCQLLIPFQLCCMCQLEVASDLSFIQSSLARRENIADC